MNIYVNADVVSYSGNHDSGFVVSRDGYHIPYTTVRYEHLLQQAIDRCNQMFAEGKHCFRWTRTEEADWNLRMRVYLGTAYQVDEYMRADYAMMLAVRSDKITVSVPQLLHSWLTNNGEGGRYTDFETYVVAKMTEALYWDVMAPMRDSMSNSPQYAA